MFFPCVFIIIILFRVIFADIFCMSYFASLFLLFHWIGLVVQYLKILFYSYCCCCSVAKSCLTLQFYGLQHTRLLSLSFTISQSLLKLMSTESVMSSNHLILCCLLLLLPSGPSPSIRVFSKELVLCIRWPKDWSCSFSISPSNEYSGLISFRTDWFDLLVVQGTLKSLLQHHSSKASIL